MSWTRKSSTRSLGKTGVRGKHPPRHRDGTPLGGESQVRESRFLNRSSQFDHTLTGAFKGVSRFSLEAYRTFNAIYRTFNGFTENVNRKWPRARPRARMRKPAGSRPRALRRVREINPDRNREVSVRDPTRDAWMHTAPLPSGPGGDAATGQVSGQQATGLAKGA